MLDTLQEAKEKEISSSSAKTPRQQEKQTTEEEIKKGKGQEQGIIEKRSREDQSPGTDISMKEFRLKYRKKPRKHMDLDKGSKQ